MAKKGTTIGEFIGLDRFPEGHISSLLAKVDAFISDPATQEELKRINDAPESERHAGLPRPAQD